MTIPHTYTEVSQYVHEKVVPAVEEVPDERQKLLSELANRIISDLSQNGCAKVLFVCTHNSRRSQLAQVWATLAAHWYDLQEITFHSDGTEVTDVNPRSIHTLERAGFAIDRQEGPTPVYTVRWSDQVDGLTCYSKLIDDVAAADQCPYVPEAAQRIHLSYNDPKKADGTGREQAVYDDRCLQIAAEMFWVIGQVANGAN